MKRQLKIGCWNINQLISRNNDKSNDTYFKKEIQSYDLFCLQEVKCKQESVLDFDGYHTFTMPRPVEKKFPVSGGMILLVNPKIRAGVKFLPSKSSEIQWLKLSKTFFGFQNDLYVCFVYIAPANSSYVVRTNIDILSLLEKDILKYSNNGDILIAGDTNARTGNEADNLDNNNNDIATLSDTLAN